MIPSACRARESGAARPRRQQLRRVLAGAEFHGDPRSLFHRPMAHPTFRVEVWYDDPDATHARWIKLKEGTEAFCRACFERIVTENAASQTATRDEGTRIRLFEIQTGREVAKAVYWVRR